MAEAYEWWDSLDKKKKKDHMNAKACMLIHEILALDDAAIFDIWNAMDNDNATLAYLKSKFVTSFFNLSGKPDSIVPRNKNPHKLGGTKRKRRTTKRKRRTRSRMSKRR